MSALATAVALLAAAATISASPRLWERVRRGFARRPAPAVVAGTSSTISTEGATGAVRSVQTAEVFLPAGALAQGWAPPHPEPLGRTRSGFLPRATPRLVPLHLTPRQRPLLPPVS